MDFRSDKSDKSEDLQEDFTMNEIIERTINIRKFKSQHISPNKY